MEVVHIKNAARLWQLIERHGGLPTEDRQRMQRVDVGWQECLVATGWPPCLLAGPRPHKWEELLDELLQETP